MPFKYWRTVVCATVLGVCGLAVWADDSLRGSKKLEPAAPAIPIPVQITAAPSLDDALPLPRDRPDCPKPDAIPALSPEPPRFFSGPLDPPTIPPDHGLRPLIAILGTEPPVPPATAAPEKPAPTSAPPSPSNEPPPLPKRNLDLPKPETDAPKLEPKPKLPTNAGGLEPKQPAVTEPRPIVERPSAPPLPPHPTLDISPRPGQTTSVPPLSQPGIVPLKMCLHAGGTDQPHFEIKDGDLLLLKVSCECVELQSQHGVIAKGQVRLHGSGVDGTCDQLIVSWARKAVELNGNVILNCSREGALLQISAEQIKLRVSGANEPTFKASGVSTIGPGSDNSKR
jgi:hypothetical protein